MRRFAHAITCAVVVAVPVCVRGASTDVRVRVRGRVRVRVRVSVRQIGPMQQRRSGAATSSASRRGVDRAPKGAAHDAAQVAKQADQRRPHGGRGKLGVAQRHQLREGGAHQCEEHWWRGDTTQRRGAREGVITCANSVVKGATKVLNLSDVSSEKRSLHKVE